MGETKKKAGVLRRYLLVRTAQHSTAQRGAAHNEHRHCWLHVRA